MVLVDAGNFYGDPDEAGRVKTQNLIDGMSMIGYASVNVGERELAEGIDSFREKIRETGLPVTSASFIYRDTSEPVFSPFALRTYTLASGREAKVAFIGVDALNSAFARPADGSRVTIMRGPAEALGLVLPIVRPLADMVVLLANLSLRDLTNTLDANPGVDLALVNYGPRLSPGGRLEEVAGVPVLYAGDQGKRMGEVRVFFDEKQGRPRLEAHHVWLTRRYPADEKLQALIDRTIQKVNDINRAKAERLAASSPKDEAAAGQEGFATASTCRSCHAREYGIYETSAHAHAFQTLIEANQDFNVECVGCHTTGFRKPFGFLNARQTPGLIDVQCEACHGHGAAHINDPQQPYGNVPPRKCFTCHTKENSPDFVFFKYWDQIKH
ncbi:MAG: multiheme c-type cytochrome [Acidobacteriota bacterium]